MERTGQHGRCVQNGTPGACVTLTTGVTPTNSTVKTRSIYQAPSVFFRAARFIGGGGCIRSLHPSLWAQRIPEPGF